MIIKIFQSRSSNKCCSSWKNITQQAEVDAMAKAINDAIDTLERKRAVLLQLTRLSQLTKSQ
ncbi:MAG: hypothetical protein ACLRQF_10865 [Thomasclavelia ramosa]